VPEWQTPEGAPLRIYWHLMSDDRRKQLFAGPHRDVDVVAFMAIDADGNKMFDTEAKVKLQMQADAAILTRVAKKMIGADRLDDPMVEEARKNS
jgi:hypothetical protein